MVKDLTITSLETITAFHVTHGTLRFVLDELQNTSIAQGQEKVDITGKGGRKLSSIKRNKTVTISGANGLLSGGLMELQTGSEFENKATEVLWTDYAVVDESHKAATAFKAVGTAGAEITELYVRNADGTLGTKLVQVAGSDDVAEGKFAYTPASKEITLHTDIKKGTELVAFYNRKITADVLADSSDKFSEKCALYIDALAEDKCGETYRVQFYIPKADFSGEFTIEFGENQAVHNFEAEALAGACGAGSNFFTYTVFGTEAADVTEAES